MNAPRCVPVLALSTVPARRRRVGVVGFSLIEVLVTMLILAFGLIGVAGLLVKGVSNASATEALTKASQLAADMADRMRANPAAALSATSEYLMNQSLGNDVVWTATVPVAPATVALQDRKAWMEALAAQLPAGEGKITNAVVGTQRQFNIVVRWSNCIGTLNDADIAKCQTNSATAYRTVNFEFRL